MMVTFISSFVFAGVLSAYIFLGRSLSREANQESLESRTRLALHTLTQDVASASSIFAQNPGTNTTGEQFILTIPGSSNVTYICDWSGGAGNGILERQLGSNPNYLVLLTKLTNFQFQYYDATTTQIASIPSTFPSQPQISIKQVCMVYTTTAGYALSGNQSNFTVVSPLVLLKNKMVLQDTISP